MKKLFLRFPLFFIAIGVLLMYLFLLGVFFNSGSQPEQSNTQIGSAPTVTPNPFTLTAQEHQFPEAIPQEFEESEANGQTGTVIVTANVADVTVKINPPALGETQSAEDQELVPQIPDQQTPFKYSSIPVGTHTLLVSKPGYYAQELPVTIINDEITRIHIELVSF